MPHTVELSAEVAPRFPDRCVVCGRDAPGDATEVSAMFNGQKPLTEAVGKLHRAAIPSCTACKAKLIRSRWLSKAIMGAAVLVAAALMYGLTQLAWLSGWRAYVAILVVALGPLLVATWIYTPYFDFRPWDRRLVFEFRSREYAEAFVAHNRGARLR